MGIITLKKDHMTNAGFGSQMSHYACIVGIANKTKLIPTLIPDYNLDIIYAFKDKILLHEKPDDLILIKVNTWEINNNLFLLNETNNYILRGDISNYKYFHDIRDDILNIFTFSKNNLNTCLNIIDKIKQKNEILVSIHFRRGDYLLVSSLNLSLNYYKEAINTIKNIHQNKNIKFLIFSDDIEWVENNFKIDNCYYVKNNNQYEDMCLMSLCDHNIIANSSFSWWGAYLNKNKNKTVICPYYYNNIESLKIDGNYFPNDWISLFTY